MRGTEQRPDDSFRMPVVLRGWSSLPEKMPEMGAGVNPLSLLPNVRRSAPIKKPPQVLFDLFSSISGIGTWGHNNHMMTCKVRTLNSGASSSSSFRFSTKEENIQR